MSHSYIYPSSDDPAVLDGLLAWSVERIRSTIEPGFCRFRSDATAIGHAINGRLVGVVIYDTFTTGDCLFHTASDGAGRWVTKEFIIRAMAYPFHQLRQRRLTALVSEHNAASLRFTRHFGWKQEGVLREAGARGEDVILFGMLLSECRWIAPPIAA